MAKHRHNKLTAARLRALLDYDPNTGDFRWKQRDELTTYNKRFNTRYAEQIAGTLDTKPTYDGRHIKLRIIPLQGKKYFAHDLAWLYTHDVWPDRYVCHINEDHDDNRITNLELRPYSPLRFVKYRKGGLSRPKRPPEWLTYDYLREILDYDPDAGVFRWRVREGQNHFNSRKAGTVAGSLVDTYNPRTKISRTYRHLSIRRLRFAAHHLAWLYMTENWPHEQITHISGDSTDNRFANLNLSNPQNQRSKRGVQT